MVLDASGNNMGGEEIEALLDLYRLETLHLADNDIGEMAQVFFFNNFYLWKILLGRTCILRSSRMFTQFFSETKQDILYKNMGNE